MFRTLFLGLLLFLAACAPSPLYVGERPLRGTAGEVPRDGQGEPIWSAIRSPAPPPPMRAQPVEAGIPVIGGAVMAPPPPYVPPVVVAPTAPAALPPGAAPLETAHERRKRCAHLKSCHDPRYVR